MNIRQRLKYEDPYPLGTQKAESAGLLTTGENMVREKYGEIAQTPPHFPGRYFTGDQPFNFKIQKFCFGCKFSKLRLASLAIVSSL